MKQLGELSSYFASAEGGKDVDRFFEKALGIIQETMCFDVSVLYKVTNMVDDALMLRVVRVSDPKQLRQDLYQNRRFQLSFKNPNFMFINEINAFQTRKVSADKTAGGCNIMGFVYLPDTFGGGYLFGGLGRDNKFANRDYQASAWEILCNYLSTILIKEQFEELAVNDNLTGLYNSRKIKEEVDWVCRRFTRNAGTHASIVICDIDHFKKVNDTYGHLQGDIVLRQIGGLLKASMRENFDVAGRYGGEEFLMIFETTDALNAFSIVERIRTEIAGHKFCAIDDTGKVDPDRHLSITVSMGIAENQSSPRPLTREEWISRADQALYRSKSEGRNRTTIWRASSS